jgi:hypothetical protein
METDSTAVDKGKGSNLAMMDVFILFATEKNY